MLLINF